MVLGERSDIVFFANGNYLQYHTVRNEWKRTLKRLGLPKRKLHWVRHSVASLLVADGVDLKKIQNQLGWATSSFMLDTYAKYIPADEVITSTLDKQATGILKNGTLSE